MTNQPDNICAHCRRSFAGAPVMLGRRLGCCSQECAVKLAPLEYARLEEWLSVIAVKCRGMGADLATSALYTNIYPAKTYRKKKL